MKQFMLNSACRNWHRTLLFIFLAALLFRGAFILSQQDGFYFPDSTSYSRAAVSLLMQGELGAGYGRAPAYPVFLAAIYGLFGESIFAVRAVESFMGAFLAIIIALLGKRAGGEIVGALAGILWSIYPMGVFIAGLVYPTGLAAMFLACAVYCALPRPREELSTTGVFAGGVFLGLAALTVPVTILTIVVVAGWIAYWARHSRFQLVSLLLLGSALALAPWTARSFLVHGRLVVVQPVEPHIPKAVRADSDSADSGLERILQRSALFAGHFGRQFLGFWQLYPDRIAMSRPGYREKLHDKHPSVVKDTVYNPGLLINLVSIMSTGPLFLFGLLGAVAMWLTREFRRDLSLLLAIIFSFAVGYSLFVGKIRYRIPVEPYIMILSAFGMAQVWQFLAQKYAWFGPRDCKHAGASTALSGRSFKKEEQR